jgi:alpha-L-rhamnosidase
LASGLVPEELVPLVEKVLLSEIEAHYNRVSTGMVTTRYLLEVLADVAPEVLWKMITTHEYPSWYANTIGSDFYLLKETWHGGQVLMPSQNGGIAGWLYYALGGIRPDSPGFKDIIIKPTLSGDLHWVSSSYHSVHGEIVSNWQKRGNLVVMDITVPCNTTATVYIPAEDTVNITESGDPIEKVEGVKFIGMENKAALYSVASGTYTFQSVVDY